MILTIGDGSSLAFILACIIAFWLYRKDQKEINEIQKKIDENQANIADFDKATKAIYSGAMVLKKDDFKHLKEKDFSYFTTTHGVKFV